jgi:hypothetical protein
MKGLFANGVWYCMSWPLCILQYITDNNQATATLDCQQSILKSRSKAQTRASGVRTHFPTIPPC